MTPDEKKTNKGKPPSAGRVARRALTLSAVVCRANPDAEVLQRQILDWLLSLDLHNEIEQQESDMLNAPLGCLESKAARAFQLGGGRVNGFGMGT
jgi:hypothetical protein